MRLFSSLQSKLIVAFAGIVVIALGLAGAAFLYVNRHEQEQHEIDRVASASPSIIGEYLVVAFRSQAIEDYRTFTRDAAKKHDVRVMLVDASGTVLTDSRSELIGKTMDVPPAREERGPGRTSYTTWKPSAGTPGAGYVLFASNVPAISVQNPASVSAGGVPASPRGGLRIEVPRLVIGVEESTIANAWISLLPGLGAAAVITLPVAALLAVLLARYITRPVKQLTVAAGQLAEGAFDIDVPSGRRDELGDLTEAFAVMTRRVGATQAQMRMLVANVSHDLKTPLTSIRGFARALHSGAAVGADAERAGAIIEEEALRLASRLDDLLLLSELDSGKAVVEHDEIDLGRLVESRVVGAYPPGEARPFALELAIEAGVTALADGPKLERVVENLLDNARKFTREGTVRVSVARHPSGSAQLEVANTCEPIEPTEVEQLFDRFYRRDRSRTGGNGTGLGLAIARDLAELQGGHLGARYSDGMLRFTLMLPGPERSA